MNQPLASIIIPVFNGERFLAETLESILAQDYSPFEVIVLDDGSTDGCASIAKSYQKIHYIYQPNQGVPVARNAGLAAAAGGFIAFSDQDDVWMPHKLRTQMGYLLRHPEAGYVLCRKRLVLEPGMEPPPWLRKELLGKDLPAYDPSGLVARRQVFGQIGRFNPELQVASDVDWIFKAKDAGIPMATLPETLFLKRVHSQNQSYQVKALHDEYLQLIRESIRQQRRHKISGRET